MNSDGSGVAGNKVELDDLVDLEECRACAENKGANEMDWYLVLNVGLCVLFAYAWLLAFCP
jgi:hypothetical protein